MNSKVKKTLIIAAAAVGALYIGISLFFLGHFQFRTTLNGNNVSLKSPAAVGSELKDSASGYVLTITGRRNERDTITAEEIGLSSDFGTGISDVMKTENAFAWPASLFRDTALVSDAVVSYDQNALTEAIDGLSCFDEDNVTDPMDATYGWNGDSFEVVVEAQGSKADKEKVTEAVTAAVNGLQTTLDLDEAGCYEKPSVTSDDPSLQQTVDELNAEITSDLTLDIGAGDTLTISKDTLKDWLVVSDEKASLDSSKVSEYVSSLADEYNTIYTNRTFTTHDGNTITTAGGTYGWWLNEDETAQAIITAFSDGTHVATAVWQEEPAARGDNSQCGKGSFGGDIGSTYVEIDLDAQHVYMWVNGSCVFDTDCVSGKAAAGNATPDGVYPITYKERDAKLVGENYVSPVSYWMPFNGNVGMHDATWRSEFGGEIYLASGSHGCVNLPLSAAQTIFGYVEKGMPVVVYGGMTQEEAQAYLGQVDEQTEEEAAANAEYLANANAIAAKYGIDTTGASVNADGSVSYAIGATIYPDGHITGADGSTIVEAPAAGTTDASGTGTSVDATEAAQAAQSAAAEQAAQAAGSTDAGQ